MATLTPANPALVADTMAPLRAPVSRGTTVDLVHGVVPSAVYRTDWQGQQRLYPTARTNLLTYSVGPFSALPWSLTSLDETSQPTGGPDGGQAYLTTEQAVTTTHKIGRTTFVVVAAGGQYAVKAIFKPQSRRYVLLRMNDGGTNANSASVMVDTDTLSISGPATAYGTWTGATAVIQAAANGFISVTLAVTVGGSTTVNAKLELSNNGSRTVDGQSNPYLGVVSSGAVIKCIEIYAGGVAGSSIPTAGAPVTLTDYTLGTDGMVTLASAVDDRKGEFISGDFPSTIARVGP